MVLKKNVFHTVYILVILYCVLHFFRIRWYIINTNIKFKFKTKLLMD